MYLTERSLNTFHVVRPEPNLYTGGREPQMHSSLRLCTMLIIWGVSVRKPISDLAEWANRRFPGCQSVSTAKSENHLTNKFITQGYKKEKMDLLHSSPEWSSSKHGSATLGYSHHERERKGEREEQMGECVLLCTWTGIHNSRGKLARCQTRHGGRQTLAAVS